MVKWKVITDHHFVMNDLLTPSLEKAIIASENCRDSLPKITAHDIACRAHLNHERQSESDNHEVDEWLCAEAELTAERFVECV